MKSNEHPTVQVPDYWYNILPDLPELPPPPREPEDGGPSRLALMERIRLPSLRAQDRDTRSLIPIPDAVRSMYLEMGRPTPLMRARRLEQYLQTPARIYVKREDLLPTGSFKLNSAVAQAYFAQQESAAGLVTETGAGQWGHAIAYACRMFGLRSVIFWADVSAQQKAARGTLIRMLDGEVHPSPSLETEVGRELRRQHCIGSLGTAIGEAITFAASHPEYKYVSGSNHPHVLLHQSVIGLETKQQLAALGERADALIACVGGGSNLGGLMGPFLREARRPGSNLTFIAAESASAPRLTKGQWRYDHSDPAGVTPLSKSYTLGMHYPLPPTHVGGLRQHNGSPVIGVLRQHGLLEPTAYHEEEVFRVGRLFAQLEGIVAAPESCHALAAAIDQARAAKLSGTPKTLVLCLSGSGLLDLDGYAAFPN